LNVFIVLLYIEFYDGALDSAWILRAVELSPSRSADCQASQAFAKHVAASDAKPRDVPDRLSLRKIPPSPEKVHTAAPSLLKKQNIQSSIPWSWKGAPGVLGGQEDIIEQKKQCKWP